jgi:hypothetical protein
MRPIVNLKILTGGITGDRNAINKSLQNVLERKYYSDMQNYECKYSELCIADDWQLWLR